ncbi:MAG: DUF1595 domain-containing protein, partial [Deltaproteobacteria bacterium]|nr:DUF1595 domain-containing protein [Deltaproteobacteria bacterium]
MFRKDHTVLGFVPAVVVLLGTVLPGCTGSIGAISASPDSGSSSGGRSGAAGTSGGGDAWGGCGVWGGGGPGGCAGMWGGGGAGASGTGSASGSGSGTGSAGSGVGPLPPVVLDPGRTVIRRLNRTEYNFTVRDLLGTTSTPANAFPADELAEGFDTVGEHLAFSLLHAEQMETSATALIDELFALPAGDARRGKVLTCALSAGAEGTCARQILTSFTRRAYRRPATPQELTALMALVDKIRVGGTYTDGLKAALTAVLLSPHFFFKEETSVGFASTAAKPLNAFEIATRLSYFLWSTMPDDALAASANGGTLATSGTELTAQIGRMLAD